MSLTDIKNELDKIRNIIDSGYLTERIFVYYNDLVFEYDMILLNQERERIKQECVDLEQEGEDLEWVLV